MDIWRVELYTELFHAIIHTLFPCFFADLLPYIQKRVLHYQLWDRETLLMFHPDEVGIRELSFLFNSGCSTESNWGLRKKASQTVATIKVKSLTPPLAAKEAVCLCYMWNSTVMYYLQGRKHAEIGGGGVALSGSRCLRVPSLDRYCFMNLSDATEECSTNLYANSTTLYLLSDLL